MEYIGPALSLCHKSLQEMPLQYQKEVGDKKGCKEVVLKEFGYCYKYYIDSVNDIVAVCDYKKACKHLESTTELHKYPSDSGISLKLPTLVIFSDYQIIVCTFDCVAN